MAWHTKLETSTQFFQFVTTMLSSRHLKPVAPPSTSVPWLSRPPCFIFRCSSKTRNSAGRNHPVEVEGRSTNKKIVEIPMPHVAIPATVSVTVYLQGNIHNAAGPVGTWAVDAGAAASKKHCTWHMPKADLGHLRTHLR